MMWVVPAVRPTCKTLGILVVAGVLALSSAFAVSGPDGTDSETMDEWASPSLAQRFPPPDDPLPQDDGESGKDADDECVSDDPPSIVFEPDAEFRGTLRPPWDRADHYGVYVDVSDEPVEVRFVLEPNPDFPPGGGFYEHRAEFLSPFCEVLLETNGSLLGGLAGIVTVHEPGVYVFAVHWDDHGLVPSLEDPADAGSTKRLTQEQTQDCHEFCTSYRGSITTR